MYKAKLCGVYKSVLECGHLHSVGRSQSAG